MLPCYGASDNCSLNVQPQYNPTHPAAGRQSVAKTTPTPETRSRYIPSSIRKIVWSRAKGRCQYPQCHSTYLLEIEHQVPFAKGGTHSPDNLVLYCRTHNALALKQEFGMRSLKRAKT